MFKNFLKKITRFFGFPVAKQSNWCEGCFVREYDSTKEEDQ